MRLAHIAQSVERSPLKRMAAGSIPVVGIRRCFFLAERRYQSRQTIIIYHHSPSLFISSLCVINSCFFSTPKSKAKGKVPPHKNICEYHFTCYCYQYNFITDQTPLKNNATYCGQTRGRLTGVQRRARSVSRDDNFCDEFITNASKKGWNVGGG